MAIQHNPLPNMKRRIVVVTGGRAEYGLLRPLLNEIKLRPDLELSLIVTGMHLSPYYGETVEIIKKDNFTIAAEIEILLSSDTGSGVAKATGLGLIGFADAYRSLNPQLVVVLGDRFESFSAALTAAFFKIPVAHIHGGELTEGALDDALRHSITKLASLHFTSHESYAHRVLQLGENSSRIFNVGSLAEDNIADIDFLDKDALGQSLGIDLTGDIAVITFHPETAERTSPAQQINPLLSALENLPKDIKLIFTMANADAGGMAINAEISKFVDENKDRAACYKMLGTERYMSLISHAFAVIGNSSSGILEAPLLNVPTVNIGTRQNGRFRSPTIIDCPSQKDAIHKAIMKAKNIERKPTILPQKHVARDIVKILSAYDLTLPLKLPFNDFPLNEV